MMVNLQPVNKLAPIGGYFSLELPIFSEYHADAIALNCGRFCLEYLLRCRKYKKVYVPYYTCDSVIEPIEKLGIEYEFYHIDRSYCIVNAPKLNKNEALIYTNYWGLQDAYCQDLVSQYGKQLILDYTQAFFSKPISGIDTFYSCRKFFGVPDGGYLYTDVEADFEIEEDFSWHRMDSLVKRIDISPEAGYDDFHKTSASFHTMLIKHMSRFTKRMMNGIDYEYVAQCRIDNYNYLRTHLGGRQLNNGVVPMVFPYETEKGQALRQLLISNKVFVAKYWPNVDKWCAADSEESWMANHILPLPIDQRYGEEDMNRIINNINL